MTQELDRYCKTLSKGLFCSKSSKSSFVSKTRTMAEDFLKDKPDAAYEDIEAFLGDPKTLSETFMETVDPNEIRHHKRSRRMIKTVLIAIPVAVIVFLCGIIYYMSQVQEDVVITKESVVHVYHD